MKKLCVWALAAMMTVGATGAMADHLDDIKAKGKLVVGSEVSFAPFEFYFVGEDGKEYEAGFEMELSASDRRGYRRRAGGFRPAV
ncbi:MAG: hypothetical protein ACLUI3_06750 [Christensenellales bacterium]